MESIFGAGFWSVCHGYKQSLEPGPANWGTYEREERLSHNYRRSARLIAATKFAAVVSLAAPASAAE